MLTGTDVYSVAGVPWDYWDMPHIPRWDSTGQPAFKVLAAWDSAV